MEATLQPLRPPAVPLVATDPSLSVWSMSDRLTDEWTRHWTGTHHPMSGLARIDGTTWRFAGPEPCNCEAMEQVQLTVLPTRTIYVFKAAGVELTLTFMTPQLPQDLDLYSWPLTYVIFSAKSIDDKSHSVSIYFDCTAQWTVNTPEQEVSWSRVRVADLNVVRMGSCDQQILGKAGDDLRIDWGFLYLAVPKEFAGDTYAGSVRSRNEFVAGGSLPQSDDLRMPRRAADDWPGIACTLDLGTVSETPRSAYSLLAYDDLYAIEYLNRRLRPYWRRNGMDAGDLLVTAETEYESLCKRCTQFDEEVLEDLRQTGGEAYARLAALAYRQCVAAHKLAADFDGKPMYFSKENFSNGCIDTVDVTYPSAPFFLLFNPELLKAQLTPMFDYSESPRWKFPFAPHDLGTFPLANGQVYGGGERTEDDQMPVEECGNMLILTAALARVEGNADYAKRYWGLMTKWAEYLREKGFDPENQLCTDDFAGHMAHNTNLSLKAIVALGCYAMLCEMAGDAQEAAAWRKTATMLAERWVAEANDGEHFRLAFDKPGSWSQKYNLVWDNLFGLGLFPQDVARKEVASYKKRLNRYGLPLDNRSEYTKLDWIVWSATLAEDKADFEEIVAPLYTWLNETPTRVPMTDWYWTTDGRMVGFQARSVVGGVYIPLLFVTDIWKKWLGRAKGCASANP